MSTQEELNCYWGLNSVEEMLSRQYIIQHAKNRYEHNAEKVTENEKAKILWDFNIQTDHIIQARRPDIVVKDKELDHT